jgi:hypothetical protein
MGLWFSVHYNTEHKELLNHTMILLKNNYLSINHAFTKISTTYYRLQEVYTINQIVKQIINEMFEGERTKQVFSFL